MLNFLSFAVVIAYILIDLLYVLYRQSEIDKADDISAETCAMCFKDGSTCSDDLSCSKQGSA